MNSVKCPYCKQTTDLNIRYEADEKDEIAVCDVCKCVYVYNTPTYKTKQLTKRDLKFIFPWLNDE